MTLFKTNYILRKPDLSFIFWCRRRFSRCTFQVAPRASSWPRRTTLPPPPGETCSPLPWLSRHSQSASLLGAFKGEENIIVLNDNRGVEKFFPLIFVSAQKFTRRINTLSFVIVSYYHDKDTIIRRRPYGIPNFLLKPYQQYNIETT